jgi:hypothetical protein
MHSGSFLSNPRFFWWNSLEPVLLGSRKDIAEGALLLNNVKPSRNLEAFLFAKADLSDFKVVEWKIDTA